MDFVTNVLVLFWIVRFHMLDISTRSVVTAIEKWYTLVLTSVNDVFDLSLLGLKQPHSSIRYLPAFADDTAKEFQESRLTPEC